MKILWFYRYMPLYDFDNWLHMKFAEAISQTKDVDLVAYGPGLDKKYQHLVLLKYQPSITLQDIKEKYFDFDVILLCTKSRMFAYYNPKTEESKGCWLPKDFASWTKTPKIVLEEDYHYEKNDKWYVENKINLILQRHFSQVKRSRTIPMIWLPFSVDVNSFQPDKEVSRLQKFCLLGNFCSPVYYYRRTAFNMLNTKFSAVCYNKVVGYKYLNALKQYLAYISCGSTEEIVAAKNFEIMASGGLLFTNCFEGIEQVFDSGTYCSYKNDFSDVYEKASYILSNPYYVTDVVNAGLECIKNRHTHKIRIAQLLQIIEDTKKGLL